MDLDGSAKLARIRTLNDSFRRPFVGGSAHITEGREAFRLEVKAEFLERVRMFERFTRERTRSRQLYDR